jgi:hypothetical protein
MRDLEGAQKALGKQLMRGEAGDVLPVHVTLPEVGGRTPAITLKSVVFPAPFGPISPVMEPGLDPQRRAVDGVKAAEMLVDVVELRSRLPLCPP